MRPTDVDRSTSRDVAVVGVCLYRNGDVEVALSCFSCVNFEGHW